MKVMDYFTVFPCLMSKTETWPCWLDSAIQDFCESYYGFNRITRIEYTGCRQLNHRALEQDGKQSLLFTINM